MCNGLKLNTQYVWYVVKINKIFSNEICQFSVCSNAVNLACNFNHRYRYTEIFITGD